MPIFLPRNKGFLPFPITYFYPAPELHIFSHSHTFSCQSCMAAIEQSRKVKRQETIETSLELKKAAAILSCETPSASFPFLTKDSTTVCRGESKQTFPRGQKVDRLTEAVAKITPLVS